MRIQSKVTPETKVKGHEKVSKLGESTISVGTTKGRRTSIANEIESLKDNRSFGHKLVGFWFADMDAEALKNNYQKVKEQFKNYEKFGIEIPEEIANHFEYPDGTPIPLAVGGAAYINEEQVAELKQLAEEGERLLSAAEQKELLSTKKIAVEAPSIEESKEIVIEEIDSPAIKESVPKSEKTLPSFGMFETGDIVFSVNRQLDLKGHQALSSLNKSFHTLLEMTPEEMQKRMRVILTLDELLSNNEKLQFALANNLKIKIVIEGRIDANTGHNLANWLKEVHSKKETDKQLRETIEVLRLENPHLYDMHFYNLFSTWFPACSLSCSIKLPVSDERLSFRQIKFHSVSFDQVEKPVDISGSVHYLTCEKITGKGILCLMGTPMLEELTLGDVGPNASIVIVDWPKNLKELNFNSAKIKNSETLKLLEDLKKYIQNKK